MKKEYTVGFAFNIERSEVVLILKDRPEWQKGFWNGTGGKIEADETLQECMAREFLEETGLRSDPQNWKLFADYKLSKARIFFLKSFMDITGACQQEGESETIRIWKISELNSLPLLPNLRWLIPLALDASSPIAQITEQNERERIE